MPSDWKITRRQGSCARCGHRFVEGEPLFSVLRFQEELLERGDLCGDCFDARDQKDDLIFWRTTHAEQRRGLRVDFGVLRAAVPILARDRRPERRDLAFLLSLLLVRHRRLRLMGVNRRQGKEFLVMRPVRSQDSFEVESRELDPDRRARLTEQLAEMLDPTREGGLEALVEGSGGDAGAPEGA